MAIKVSNEIKLLVLANPDEAPAAIVAKLKERNINTTEGSVAGYRSDFLSTLALLRENGLLNGDKVQAPTPKPAKVQQKSRADRWGEACSNARNGLEDLVALKEEYEEWKDNLPENLQQSPVAEKLEAVCDLDFDSAIEVIDEAEGVDLPLGFGRD